jgi:hypothetical protein
VGITQIGATIVKENRITNSAHDAGEVGMKKYWLASVAFLVALTVVAAACAAEKKYDPGVSDTEIMIGQTMPYSGPVSVYGQIGQAQLAYFAKINAEGGINGRKIKLVSLDDGYQPFKALEQVRRLVEQDKVLLVFNSVGTATNITVRSYLNAKKVPHLFVAGGDDAWGDYQHYPWTIGWEAVIRRRAGCTPSTSWRTGRTQKSRFSCSTTTTGATM